MQKQRDLENLIDELSKKKHSIKKQIDLVMHDEKNVKLLADEAREIK